MVYAGEEKRTRQRMRSEEGTIGGEGGPEHLGYAGHICLEGGRSDASGVAEKGQASAFFLYACKLFMVLFLNS